MKPEYEKILEPAERSFTYRLINRDQRPLLSQAWHYHPELEICFTLKSEGRRFVGNQIADYTEGDLVMFGANLPHGFTTDVYCSQIVVQMAEDFLGKPFLDAPETQPIRSLFNRSRQGLEFFGTVREKSKKLLLDIMEAEQLTKLRLLLELLQLLAETDEVRPICSKEYAIDFNVEDLSKIKVVYDHVMENFQEKVSIPKLAAQLNISESSFYKFVKRHTKKTYTQIINEFRVNYAGKLLMSTNMSIAEICFASGYNNVSYFNRKFKQLMGLTPDGFRRRYQ